MRPRSVQGRSAQLGSWPESPALHVPVLQDFVPVLQDISRRSFLVREVLSCDFLLAREIHILRGGTCAAAGGCERYSELGTLDTREPRQ